MLLTETLNLLKIHKIRLKDSLSQNFLINCDVKNRIIKELQLKDNDTILEIGSGMGLITREIAGFVKKMICVEIDPNLIPILSHNLKMFKNIEIINIDILKIDLSKVLKERAKVFGLLPYYITTPIILHLLKFNDYILFSLLVLQYEVSKRLIATSGRDYGILSVLTHIYTKPELIMKIEPSSFIPRPKPYSSLIKLNFLKKPQIALSSYTFKILDILFSQKRKKIINSLSKLKLKRDVILYLLKNAGIDPNCRPEELPIFDIERIGLEYEKLVSTYVSKGDTCLKRQVKYKN